MIYLLAFTEARFDNFISLRSSAGTWVFDRRRWLNPSNPRELQELRQVIRAARLLYTFAAVRIEGFSL